jgi:DNA transformation protein and related proteins
MSVSSDFLEYVLEQLSRVAGVRTRRMFGAVGLYSDDHFFAIVDDDVLYLKADETTSVDYVARGMRRFMPDPTRPEASMGYYEVPADVIEDRDELAVWARKAVRVGAAASARKRPKVKAPKKRR